MGDCVWITGDARTVMAGLEPGSVDLVITSPPFLGVRSYLPMNDPARAFEVGTETDPGAFVDVLLDVTEAAARLLAPHGTLAVELGDTYSGDRARGIAGAGRDGPAARDGWPLSKSLCGIPEMYRLALIYGRSLATGRATDPWRVRNVVRWVRPNPPVGSLGDKFRPATSEMVIACKSATRWFDLDAVRVPHADPRKEANRKREWLGGKADALGHMNGAGQSNPAGAPPLDWWSISSGIGYFGSHYAVFPPELVECPIEAMCPRRVCRTCGVPSRRLSSEGVTTGWSTCGCVGADGVRLDGFHTGSGWRPGVVLDPFGGSGTTAIVATGHGRDCISIELDRRNVELARERVGMWLREVDPVA